MSVSRVLVGMDLGGTKAHVVVESVDGHRLVDQKADNERWEAEPPARAARWIHAMISDHLPIGHQVVSAAIGAQGVNNVATARAIEAELRALGMRAAVMNDARLVIPAAGLAEGIGVIAGTGAIAVGTDVQGRYMTAGGWGSVIGDDAGAAGIVREAARAALSAHDHGDPDDGLLAALLASFDVVDAERLARAVNDRPTAANWAPHAPSVFRAAAAGSYRARLVIDHAGDHLAVLVHELIRRGAVGRFVVASGSVIKNQPTLLRAFEQRVSRMAPGLRVQLLGVEPVEGAVRVARELGDAADDSPGRGG